MCRGVVVTDEEGDLVGGIVVVETHWKSININYHEPEFQ